jgi:membrane fusion protein (multidrug efflux system)
MKRQRFRPHALWVAGLCAGLSLGARAQDSGCLIEPSADLKLGVPADGVLDRVMVERGDTVRKGQLLGRLNVDLESAQARTLATKLAFGERKLERNLELRDQNLIAPQELDEIATNQKVAELEYAESQERIKLRNIHSPVDGVVVDVYYQVGDLIKQEKIFRVARLDPLYVEMILPASRFGQIKPGQPMRVLTELGARELKGEVGAVDKVIDAASSTFRVRLIVPNPDNRVPSGQRCRIRF